ncbi:hypothetical protein CLTEP_25190 [Clostridium tepidiprofundi DSM 19306]|uniref:Uncharacterized protein n=1 Tax=Clostridium tepidiprofundi DSM 19306 TaxID=1121338 RepID=A0A151ASS5_9CLOT|nr:hypothetical protein [Clostridium tepidiprofundi]KYH30699.1 hypothetical protein CLTEP_25190 [Clostridium tepidiprofundi DSM 19306]
MDWKHEYKNKLVSIEEAAGKIESGDRCWISAGSSAPAQLIDAICTSCYYSKIRCNVYCYRIWYCKFI